MSRRLSHPDHPFAIFIGDKGRARGIVPGDAAGAPRSAPEQHAATIVRGDVATEPPVRAQVVDDLRERIRDIEARMTARTAGGSSPSPTPARMPRSPGESTDEPLAELPRLDGETLRVAIGRWMPPDDPGRVVVSVHLRLWQGRGATAKPMAGKGLAVKPHELRRVAAALIEAADRLEVHR